MQRLYRGPASERTASVMAIFVAGFLFVRSENAAPVSDVSLYILQVVVVWQKLF